MTSVLIRPSFHQFFFKAFGLLTLLSRITKGPQRFVDASHPISLVPWPETRCHGRCCPRHGRGWKFEGPTSNQIEKRVGVLKHPKALVIWKPNSCDQARILILIIWSHTIVARNLQNLEIQTKSDIEVSLGVWKCQTPPLWKYGCFMFIVLWFCNVLIYMTTANMLILQ